MKYFHPLPFGPVFRMALALVIPAATAWSQNDSISSQTMQFTSPDAAASDAMGTAVSVSGNLLAAGSPSRKVLGAAYAGAVCLFDGTSGKQVRRISAPGGSAADYGYFGTAVSLSGKLVLIGAPGEFTGAAEGSAWLYDTSDGTVVHHWTLKDTDHNAQLGGAVALSGPVAVVGRPGFDLPLTDSGEVLVYNAATGGQSLRLRLPAPGAYDRFGAAVAVDGQRVIASAPGRNGTRGEVRGFDAMTGAALFTLTAPSAAPGDYLGTSLAISGNLLVAGSPYKNNYTGMAFLFDASTQQAWPLVPSDAAVGDKFGNSVAISNGCIYVGAPNHDKSRGAVYVFDAATGTQLRKLTGSHPWDHFGNSLSASAGSVATGTPGYDPSAALPDAGTISVMETASIFAQPGQDGQHLGNAVAAWGDRILAGAAYHDASDLTSSGRSVLWNTNTGIAQMVNPPLPEDGNQAGYSVGLSDEIAAMGAIFADTPTHDSGSVSLYNPTTAAWLRTIKSPTEAANDHMGAAVAVAGKKVLSGAPGSNGLGRAYLHDGTTGSLLNTFVPPWSEAGTGFGEAVSLSAWSITTGGIFTVNYARAAVGAPARNAGAVAKAGAVVLYDALTGNALGTLTAPEPEAEAGFGQSVSVHQKLLVVGEPFASGGGAVHVYRGSPPVLAYSLPAPAPALNSSFGYSVATDGTLIAVADSDMENPGITDGAVSVFRASDGFLLRTCRMAFDGAGLGLSRKGWSVALRGGRVVAGVPKANINGLSHTGAVLEYDLRSVLGDPVFFPPTSPAIRILALKHDSATNRLAISVLPGQPFDLQTSTDLTNWSNAKTGLKTTTSLEFLHHLAGVNAPRRFYRLAIP